MDTLEAIVDRLIPADETPGGLDRGVAATLRARLGDVEELLERLRGFETWDAVAQDAELARLVAAGDPAFALLVDLAHAAFYADPATWPGLGYTTNVPGRP